ncbi:hypothetical protein MTO96_034556, partial [Rhipicephalus appendiculatus]
KPLSDDLCTPGVNNYIEGVTPLLGTSTVSLASEVTSLTMTRQNGATVVWVGDRKGSLHKYLILGSSLTSKPLWTYQLSSMPIEKTTAVDHDGSYGFFLAHDRVIRFPIGSCIVYEDCFDCLRKREDPLRCGWCDDRCAHSHECPKGKKLVSDHCPIKVFPKTGPTAGGTRLQIRGQNFTINNSTKNITVTLGGQWCINTSLSESGINCTTPPKHNASKVDIVLFVADELSDEFRVYDAFSHVIASGFEFKDPTITNISPNHGPIAGGTLVILHGTGLDSGFERRVTIGTKECRINRVNETFLECISSPVNSSFIGQSLQVKLTTDDFEVPFTSTSELDSMFIYKLNPVIESIVPVEASVSFREEPIISVTGTNLDSVATPVMITQVAVNNSTKGEKIEKACVVINNGKQMTCIGPPVEEFTAMNGSPGYFTFNYRLQLSIDRFPDEGVVVNFGQRAVEIKGTLFDKLINSTLLSIRVDSVDDACDVTKIKSVRIVCTLTSTSWNDSVPHELEVVYGDRVYPVGSIRLLKPVSWSFHGAVAGIVVAVLLAFAVGVGFVFYWRLRISKAKPPAYIVDFDNSTIGNRASDGGDSKRHQETISGVTRQGVENAAFQMDEETRALLEADKLLFKREFVVLGPVVGQGECCRQV